MAAGANAAQAEFFADLIGPEHVLMHDSLGAISGRRFRLPRPVSSFVGRANELQAVTQLLRNDAVRLLTLTGAGGSGKTRLALAAAAAVEDDFANGSVFVPLAAVSEAELVPAAIAKALAIEQRSGEPVLETVKTEIQGTSLLLVVDNLEQVTAGTPSLSELLEVAFGLKVLATSRTPLSLSGERLYVVPPLQVPDTGDASAQEIMQCDSVALIVERARAVNPALEVSDESARALGEVCARVDGLPLAIELAAARLDMLTPGELLAQLDDRLGLLSRSPRDVPERQKTLRATIEWSCDLLNPEEQRVFDRLAVFAGGWTLEAAEFVCEAGLDELAGLIRSSLIQRRHARFAVLATIHDFAWQRFRADEDFDRTSARHASYFDGLAGAACQDDWLSPRVISDLETEIQNFHRAFAWAQKADPELAARIATRLWRFMEARHPNEGLMWLDGIDQGADLTQLPDAVAADVHRALGGLAYREGDLARALAHTEGAVRLYEELDDAGGTARALNVLGVIHAVKGDVSLARGCFERSVEAHRRAGSSEELIASPSANMVRLAFSEGDYKAARESANDALTLCRRLHLEALEAMVLIVRAEVALLESDTAAAREDSTKALELCRNVGYDYLVADGLRIGARVAICEDRPGDALDMIAEVRARDRVGDPVVIEALADALIARAEVELGLTVRATAGALRARDSVPPTPADLHWERLALEQAAKVMSGAAQEQAHVRGSSLSVDEAVELAFSETAP